MVVNAYSEIETSMEKIVLVASFILSQLAGRRREYVYQY